MNAPHHVSNDLLELEVSELWKRALKRDDIGLDEEFFEAGGDSISAMMLLGELELLTRHPSRESERGGLTIRHIAEVLKDRMPARGGCVVQAKAGAEALEFHEDLEASDV